ncbi:hypothetical protein [Candidatus Finniella inopinata]|uniref:Uncharacterized protein n=1 Tax=Candidatus Finniella inopinata TaxID=1696036 RepID=A0A4Q7DFZ7_9PROT|nr:hypothetical protein [Candidatus Finniella inopinata]RZI45693.1 hypothetical protein EQU50_06215 [Candidatus Finniella inopinata]
MNKLCNLFFVFLYLAGGGTESMGSSDLKDRLLSDDALVITYGATHQSSAHSTFDGILNDAGQLLYNADDPLLGPLNSDPANASLGHIIDYLEIQMNKDGEQKDETLDKAWASAQGEGSPLIQYFLSVRTKFDGVRTKYKNLSEKTKIAIHHYKIAIHHYKEANKEYDQLNQNYQKLKAKSLRRAKCDQYKNYGLFALGAAFASATTLAVYLTVHH